MYGQYIRFYKTNNKYYVLACLVNSVLVLYKQILNQKLTWQFWKWVQFVYNFIRLICTFKSTYIQRQFVWGEIFQARFFKIRYGTYLFTVNSLFPELNNDLRSRQDTFPLVKHRGLEVLRVLLRCRDAHIVQALFKANVKIKSGLNNLFVNSLHLNKFRRSYQHSLHETRCTVHG